MVDKVQNKEELRSRKGTPYSTILLLGINSPGDGKGGIFFWNDTSTSTDDNQNFFKVTSVTTGRWHRASSGVTGATEINEIVTLITNNQTFTNDVVNTTIQNVFNDNRVVTSALNELNVEIQDINGKTLFFAFKPNEIPQIEEEIQEILQETPTIETISCELPSSVEVLGNLIPFVNTTETYTLNITEGIDYTIVWTIKGGVILGDIKASSVEVEWGNDISLSGIHVGISCVVNEVFDAIYDFNFFVLQKEEGIITNPISELNITNVTGSSSCQ
jgi:hypothetical protein